jgi:radical SAM superfamily enzyme YgiQ (UPF0313 family)
VKVEQVQWATKAAQRHGIEVGMFLMWGYDGETEDDIAATIEHVKRSNPNIFFTTVAYPIKNTAYYEKVAGKLVLEKDWLSATDRDYAIKGRHSRNYYKQADRWLRSSVAAFRVQAENPGEAARLQAEADQAHAAMRLAASEVEA